MAQSVISKESQLFQDDIDLQENPELAIGAIEALQDFEIEEYQRLDAMKKTLQDGKTVPKYKIMDLGSKYMRLQHESEEQRRVQWTLEQIERFHRAEIGDPKRLDTIKNALEEGKTLDEKEISYLKQGYKVLRKVNQYKNKMLEDAIKGLK